MSESQRYTLTKRDKSYVDISLASFATPSPITNDLTVLTNDRAINNALKNLIQTLPSEVPFNYDVGSTAMRNLFELASTANATLLQFEVERAILFGEPRVTFKEPTIEEIPNYNKYGIVSDEVAKSDELGVTVLLNPEQNGYEVTIKYRIVGSEKRFTTQQILTPTR
tara:strand:- start:207 stop:707 length:501 start_codon:yes stop_codon:yes gene_type:complete